VTASSWFVVLASIVAFNTLIYVGLTLSKIIPWPHQFRPAQVRRMLARVGLEGRVDARPHVPGAWPQEDGGPADQWRYRAVRQETPFVFAVSGGLVMLFAIVVTVFDDGLPFWVHVVELLVGLGLLIVGAGLWYRPVRARVMIRSFAVAATLIVLLLVVESVASESQVPAVFALLVMTAFMPLLLDGRAAVTASATMLAGIAVIDGVTSRQIRPDFVLLAVSALLIGAVLLFVRLRTFRDITDLQTRLLATATTNRYTGLLTPRGLMTLVPGLAANASRAHQPIGVARVRISSWDADEQRYGRIYTQAVAVAVADAVRASTRAGDAVAQWADDEVLVVGPGKAPEPDALRRRLEDVVAARGISLGRPPVELSVSAADGDPDEETFEGLLIQASARAVIVG
jgi:GGDEF domain-containing protein